jgi:hypothetical protein
MSVHQYMPDQAVLADSWTLFCPECAQKMGIIMAAPAPDGKETCTFECVSGHREWMTVVLSEILAFPREARDKNPRSHAPGVSNFAQTPDGQRRNLPFNRYAIAKRSAFNSTS